MFEGFFWFAIFDSGIFLGGKFGKYFIRWLELSRGFWGCSFNNLNIPDGAHISCLRSSANKVQPSKAQGVGVNYLCFLEIFTARKLAMGFFVVNFWSRDLFRFCWKP